MQLEIDTVIGQFCQPAIADKENMPYTSAVLSEVLRMGNIVPLGVPRMSTSDTTSGWLPPAQSTWRLPALPLPHQSEVFMAQVPDLIWRGNNQQDLMEISQLYRKYKPS